jgi:hypothetical protein
VLRKVARRSLNHLNLITLQIVNNRKVKARIRVKTRSRKGNQNKGKLRKNRKL